MNEELVQAVTDRLAAMLAQDQELPAALLVGGAPTEPLGYRYVAEKPYGAVVIGRLSYTQLLFFREEAVYSALAEGLPVYLWLPGLPHRQKPCRSRPLLSRLSTAERELRSLGILPAGGSLKRRFISGEEARRLKAEHEAVPPGAVLSPLARDILERGKDDLP